MIYLGVDLGGTNLRLVAIDVGRGEIIIWSQTPTRAEEGPPSVIERMASLIQKSMERLALSVYAIGIGVPGLYDPTTQTTRFLPNLPTTWRDIPLGPEIERRTGLPTVLINDARAFTLAEALWGAGRDAHTVVGITLGTGIGGGVVIGGRLLFGIDGTAGEVGHQIIDPHGPRCGCGSQGCLEAHASGPAIAAAGMKAVRQGRTTRIRDLVDGDLNAITPEIIVQAAEAGDTVAREILEEAGFYLGIGIANLITLFSPDVVVIGGGVAQAGDWLLQPIRRIVRERCRVTPIDRVRILPAALGGQAGAVGAALWASQQVTSPEQFSEAAPEDM